MYLGSWKIDDYLTFTCNTHTPSTGAVTDADAVPTYRVYEDETGTAIATGNTAKLDDANTTGYYSERIQLTAVAGYEKGKTYSIRVSATVGGVTGDMGHTFQIEAEVDSNIVSDKTGFGLAADQSTVTVGTVTTLTGHTAQTGDNYARIGATGSGLTSLAQAATALTNLTWTDAKAGYIDHSIATVDTNVDTLLTRITAAVALASVCTETRLAELDAANLPTDIANVKTDTAAILEDTGTTIPDMMSAKIEDVMAVLGGGGDIYYVSKSGDNSDGTTWAKAKTTIDAAIALCTPNNADRIFVFAGTYDETANGATGVACDVVGIKIIGIMPGVVVKNTNTTNAGKVFSVTADDVWIHNMFATKGETTSDNSIVVDVDGAGISADIRDVTVAVEKASHTGIRFTGGAVGCGYVNGPMSISYIYSAAGVGTGIEAANCNNCVAIVHNGIIENHEELRAEQIKAGFNFTSDTDTEVIVHQIQKYLNDESSLFEAVKKSINDLEGAYALGVVSTSEPDTLICARKGSPLVIGVGENENFIASDMSALLSETNQFIILHEGDMAVIKSSSIDVFDEAGNKAKRDIHESKLSGEAVDKGEYAHYMLKEIFEQPIAIADTLEGRLGKDTVLDSSFGPKAIEIFDKIKSIQIINLLYVSS